MALTNYGELKAEIANFLNRDDLTSAIPTFISLAEADMLRDKRAYSWRSENRATTAADGQYSALPSDFQAIVRTSISTSEGWERLSAISQAEMIDARSQGNTAGKPHSYTITAGEIELFPTPDDSYTVELVYKNRFAKLYSDTDYNWVLTYHPDAYLYGALMHSAPYLADDARLAIWGALYQSALDAIEKDDISAKFSGTGLKLGVPR